MVQDWIPLFWGRDNGEGRGVMRDRRGWFVTLSRNHFFCFFDFFVKEKKEIITNNNNKKNRNKENNNEK
jgi:hypothetical protein